VEGATVDFLSDFTTSTHLPLPTIAMRLLVALVLGALIGIEREWRRRPAGLRTHMVTALAASVFTILTAEIIHTTALSGEGTQSDPVRVIEAVTAGVAFLAAGTIIQSRRGVKGLTTGAGMWLAGAIGVAAGLGQFRVGAMAAVLGLIVIAIIGWLEAAAEDKREDSPDD
jgi:putative Mg2+ transporter-C (MgtC) family protein